MTEKKASQVPTRPDLRTEICGIPFQNPVIAASGTFGFGREYAQYTDLNTLGGISVKGLTRNPRKGNPPPRIAETPGGILNSVGLQNPGVEAFLREELPFLLSHQKLVVLANAAGSTPDEYLEMVEILSDSAVHAIELNVSCPNVKEGGATFGGTPESLYQTVDAVRGRCKKPLIVKLTPNTDNIGALAAAAEAAGADAISLINTITGMKVDIHTRRPVLKNNTGGLSGPAIMPVAVRMTHQVAAAVKIPVVGMGGIATGDDAVEFLLCGASAVMVGTANFADPAACGKVIDGIEEYLIRHHEPCLSGIIGTLKLWGEG